MKTYFGSINFGGWDFFLALTIIPPKTFMAVTVPFDVVLVAGMVTLVDDVDEEDTLKFVLVEEKEVVVVVVVDVVLVVVEGFSLKVVVTAESVSSPSLGE